MALKPWTTDQLKKELERRPEIKAWAITQEHVRRRERYFLLEGELLAIDQDREVHAHNVTARIVVHLDKPERQGEITKKLFPAFPLKEQLDAAVEAARKTDHQAWDFPTQIPADLPLLATADPRLAEDIDGAMTGLSSQLREIVARKDGTVFNSAEIFLSIHDRELHLSNGLVHRSSQSRAYAEAAYSVVREVPGKAPLSDEYLNARWAVNIDDLSLADLLVETTERVKHSLDVVKPEPGKYPVIVDAEVLAALFTKYVAQVSGANEYHGLPFIKPGEEFVHGASGDLISLRLDPYLEYGADTAALSEQGVEQKPLLLIDNNRVVATAADKQYADYLAKPVTTSRGNVVLEPGRSSYDELTQAGPRVLEILQLSGLVADPNTGTFSSEIRLGRLFDNATKKVTYIKGGSLSGSMFENFVKARFADKRVRRAHFSANEIRGAGYFGPAYALLNDVSIVG